MCIADFMRAIHATCRVAVLVGYAMSYAAAHAKYAKHPWLLLQTRSMSNYIEWGPTHLLMLEESCRTRCCEKICKCFWEHCSFRIPCLCMLLSDYSVLHLQAKRGIILHGRACFLWFQHAHAAPMGGAETWLPSHDSTSCCHHPSHRFLLLHQVRYHPNSLALNASNTQFVLSQGCITENDAIRLRF